MLGVGLQIVRRDLHHLKNAQSKSTWSGSRKRNLIEDPRMAGAFVSLLVLIFKVCLAALCQASDSRE